MNALEIKVVSKMIDPNRKMKRRITLKDMSRMKLNDIEKNAKELKQKIEKGEVDNYTVNTFTTLCGKAIEELNRNNDELKQFEFMDMMKNVLQMEQVNKLTEMEQKQKKEGNQNIKNENSNNTNNNKVEGEKKESDKNIEDNKELYEDIKETNKSDEDKNKK